MSLGLSVLKDLMFSGFSESSIFGRLTESSSLALISSRKVGISLVCNSVEKDREFGVDISFTMDWSVGLFSLNSTKLNVVSALILPPLAKK